MVRAGLGREPSSPLTSPARGLVVAMLSASLTRTAFFADLWQNPYPGPRRTPPSPTSLVRRSLPQPMPTGKARSSASCVKRGRGRRTGPADTKGRTLKTLPGSLSRSVAHQQSTRDLGVRDGRRKTFTALQAISEAVRKHGETPIVLVPDTTLFAQWYAELSAASATLDAKVLRAGAGHSEWRGVLRDWTTAEAGRHLVLATVQTARSHRFRSELARGQRRSLVADEVHRLGSPSNRALLDETLFGPRLGLSERPNAPATLKVRPQFSGTSAGFSSHATRSRTRSETAS